MESRQDRFERENRHFKKKMKRSAHQKNKMRRMQEEGEEMEFKRKRVRDYDEPLHEDDDDAVA